MTNAQRDTNKGRPVSFEEARRRYVYRYTMEHVPAWAKQPAPNGKFYAPQFRTDREWYDNALFKGEEFHDGTSACMSMNCSFPLGEWLDNPYTKR